MRKSSSRQPPAMRNPFRPANPRLASLVGQRPRLRALAAQSARALLRRSPSRVKRAQGRPGADNAPAVCCAKCTRRKPHSSIQVVPITRPSLRDGRTAYAALSREPSSLWPPSPRRKSPAPRRLTRLPHSQGLDRSNDGQDHTVLPYARPAISPQFSRPCRRSRKLADEAKPDSAVRPRDAQDSRRAIRPAPGLSRPTLPRPPQSPAREHDDHTIAPQDEPGWTTCTAKQNFGKVEYFSDGGLTRGDTASSP